MRLLKCYLFAQDARRIQRHVEQVQRKKRRKRRTYRETRAAAAAAHSQRKHRRAPRQVPFFLYFSLSFFPYPRCYIKRFCPVICCRNRWLIRCRMFPHTLAHALPLRYTYATGYPASHNLSIFFFHHTETGRASLIRLSGWRRKKRRMTF